MKMFLMLLVLAVSIVACDDGKDGKNGAAGIMGPIIWCTGDEDKDEGTGCIAKASVKGEKGDTYEGGVRVPGIAWWPGMIEAGQEPIDLIQATDLFTTVVRIADALDEIPKDRVTDGVDQTALLLLGEGKSHRDYIFHYNKDKLEAVRKDQLKFRTMPEKRHHNFYNIYHDPGERFADLARYGLWAVPGFKKMIEDHLKMMEKYPNRVQKSYQRDFDRPFDPEK